MGGLLFYKERVLPGCCCKEGEDDEVNRAEMKKISFIMHFDFKEYLLLSCCTRDSTYCS